MDKKGNPHHLIMGELIDFLTETTVLDTHDERYRQKIARLLVENSGFSKQDISNNISLTVKTGERQASLKIDFLVSFQNKHIMMIRYAPGSLVTRRLSTLALSRIACAYQIPYVVITNGEDAEIINGETGKLYLQGLEKLPDKKMIKNTMSQFSFKPIEKKIFDQASKIAYACEIDGACPCDTDICIETVSD